MTRPAHLNLFVAGHGYHEASWRVSPTGGGPLGLDHFVDIAQLAERGVLDSIFFADAPGVAAVPHPLHGPGRLRPDRRARRAQRR